MSCCLQCCSLQPHWHCKSLHSSVTVQWHSQWTASLQILQTSSLCHWWWPGVLVEVMKELKWPQKESHATHIVLLHWLFPVVTQCDSHFYVTQWQSFSSNIADNGGYIGVRREIFCHSTDIIHIKIHPVNCIVHSHASLHPTGHTLHSLSFNYSPLNTLDSRMSLVLTVPTAGCPCWLTLLMATTDTV